MLGLLAGGHGGLPAAIANAVERYRLITGGETFEREAGVELLVETARLWRSLGHHDAAGRFRINGVTGPDEYRAVADNNVYTNLMAARNLRAAAEAVERHPDVAKRLAVDEKERPRAGGTPPKRSSSRTTSRST
jgi:alpha,alpha-trehalose phosphorylase